MERRVGKLLGKSNWFRPENNSQEKDDQEDKLVGNTHILGSCRNKEEVDGEIRRQKIEKTQRKSVITRKEKEIKCCN